MATASGSTPMCADRFCSDQSACAAPLGAFGRNLGRPVHAFPLHVFYDCDRASNSASGARSQAASAVLMACCHVQTLESTWERPESLSWRTVVSAEHQGRFYYVNDRSHETSWEKPASLAWEKQVFAHNAASPL